MTSVAMRVKVYQKLRAKNLSTGQIAKITETDLDSVKHAFRKTRHYTPKKTDGSDGTIREKENASAPQGESRTPN